MSDQYQSDTFNKELSSALNKLPKDIKWAATIFPQNHEEKLRSMNVELPVLSARAVEKRKNEFYAGRWCAAEAVYQKKNSYLTPKINADRSPLWPEGIVGSISHAKDKAISVVTTTDERVGLGVDIQDEISEGAWGEISNFILNTDETKLCSNLMSSKFFAVFFSAKESVYKALYPSCLDLFEHKDVEIINVNKHNDTLEIRLLRDLKTTWVKGEVFTVQYFIAQTYVLTWVYLDIV
jgi:enterobactin synthetase component D